MGANFNNFKEIARLIKNSFRAECLRHKQIWSVGLALFMGLQSGAAQASFCWQEGSQMVCNNSWQSGSGLMRSQIDPMTGRVIPRTGVYNQGSSNFPGFFRVGGSFGTSMGSSSNSMLGNGSSMPSF